MPNMDDHATNKAMTEKDETMVERTMTEVHDRVERRIQQFRQAHPHLPSSLSQTQHALFWQQLPQLFMASEFAADQLEKLWPLMFEGRWSDDDVSSGQTASQHDTDTLWVPFEKGQQYHEQGLRRLINDRADSGGGSLLECLPESTLLQCLRHYRNREMVRLIWRDVVGEADLWETTANLSEMASASLQMAIDYYTEHLIPTLGVPYSVDGEPQALAVLGLGKLGAMELNLSSDIDLIFVYEAQGSTSGGRREVDNQHYFITLGQKVINALHKVTEDGFVFRVDMRLRPFGSTGPLAQSFLTMENYYQTQGRDWERYALIKARPVAGKIQACQRLLDLLRPFIYRRYIDYSVFESLREMKGLIRQEVGKRGKAGNIKIGAGGIREIEFIAQVFQLVRGGQDGRLREPQIRRVYSVLQAECLLPDAVVCELMEAYQFLRTLEHRLQGYADRQTHELPSDGSVQQRIALSMGFEAWQGLSVALDQHRANVHGHFSGVVEEPGVADEVDEALSPYRQWWFGRLSEEEALALIAPRCSDPERVLAFYKRFCSAPVMSHIQSIARERLNQLMPRLLQQACSRGELDIGLPRVLDVILSILRRSAYISLLNESPYALTHLISLCYASPWIAEQLAQQPILWDELLDAVSMLAPPPRDDLKMALAQDMARLPHHGQEEVMEQLRHFKHAHALRVAAAEVSGSMPIMRASDYLTYLAEVIIRAVRDQVWQAMTELYGHPGGLHADVIGRGGQKIKEGLVIVAYGKLGGLELGYGSDLDLVFLHPALPQGMTEGERSIDNATFYARVVQKITHMLTVRTASGVLYDIDLRLRPSGGAGLLVSTIDSFDKYQREKAWTWEHQALVRARAIVGSSESVAKFEQVRRATLCTARDGVALKADVLAMRERMLEYLVTKQVKADEFDLKHSRGGIVDIEFMVQYAVLRWAHQYSELVEYTDNVRILDCLAKLALFTSEDVAQLKAAYLFYRSHIHRLALQNRKKIVPLSLVADHPAYVRRKWERLFNHLR